MKSIFKAIDEDLFNDTYSKYFYLLTAGISRNIRVFCELRLPVDIRFYPKQSTMFFHVPAVNTVHYQLMEDIRI